ncbi:unnamed protein product [Camellia sinensis]
MANSSDTFINPPPAIRFLFFSQTAPTRTAHTPNYNNKHMQKPAWRSDEQVMGIYREWIVKHGKTQNGLAENEKRFEVFRDNLRFIDEHNSDNRSMYLGAKTDAMRRFVKSKSVRQRYAVRTGEGLPESIDWRERGAVAPIKDQGSCGRCWAFSTVAAVEGINQIASGGAVIQLSEQQLVDCDRTYNAGCDGGLMDYAFDSSSATAASMPKITTLTKASMATAIPLGSKNAKVATIDGYEDVPPYDEKALKKAVAHQPLSVAIEATGRAFQLYVT